MLPEEKSASGMFHRSAASPMPLTFAALAGEKAGFPGLSP